MNKHLNNQIQIALDQGCMDVLKRIDIVSYIYMCYKQWYYLGKPIVSDAEFDKYEEMLKKRWPDNPVLQVVGLIHPKVKCNDQPKKKKKKEKINVS